MIRVFTYDGKLGATAECFHQQYAESHKDIMWAWRNLGSRFSALPMTFRWQRTTTGR